MVHTKLFLSNRTQAVRLPKDVAFPEDVSEVEITVEGEARLIRPVRVDISWGGFFELRDALRREFPDSELPERDQPEPQERVWRD
ncbi:toxin-antitoxin system antitoxin VapB [Nocardioides sp. AN3]